MYVDLVHYLYTNLVRSDQKDTERVAHVFISSKLDYCNGLYFGLPSSEIWKLQNSFARLITRAKILNMITPVHCQSAVATYRTSCHLQAYTALNGLAPDYLLTFYKPVHTLGSSRSINLSVPRSRTSPMATDPLRVHPPGFGTNVLIL